MWSLWTDRGTLVSGERRSVSVLSPWGLTVPCRNLPFPAVTFSFTSPGAHSERVAVPRRHQKDPHSLPLFLLHPCSSLRSFSKWGLCPAAWDQLGDFAASAEARPQHSPMNRSPGLGAQVFQQTRQAILSSAGVLEPLTALFCLRADTSSSLSLQLPCVEIWTGLPVALGLEKAESIFI